jgi:hypothetical protein
VTDERVPATLEAIVRAIAGGDDDDQRATTFARGLALGALVGAAIAGSTIWQRRHASHAQRADEALLSPASVDRDDRPSAATGD